MSAKINRPTSNADRQQIAALREHNDYLRNELLKSNQTRAMLSPAQVVAELIVHRTVGDDIRFGRCTHALQMLPNNTVLLLVTEEGAGAPASTFVLGEECPGFTVHKPLIETPDASDKS